MSTCLDSGEYRKEFTSHRYRTGDCFSYNRDSGVARPASGSFRCGNVTLYRRAGIVVWQLGFCRAANWQCIVRLADGTDWPQTRNDTGEYTAHYRLDDDVLCGNRYANLCGGGFNWTGHRIDGGTDPDLCGRDLVNRLSDICIRMEIIYCNIMCFHLANHRFAVFCSPARWSLQ